MRPTLPVVPSPRSTPRARRPAALRRLVLPALLALLAAAPALAQAPVTRSWSDAILVLGTGSPARSTTGRAPTFPATTRSAGKRAVLQRLDVRQGARARAASSRATLVESEPNDGIATADSAALGDQATGVIDPQGEADTWFVDLTAGQFLSADVDAQSIGSPLDPELTLIAPDGRSVVAFNDDFDGLDSRISYRVPASGRYYLVIRGFGNSGGPGLAYAIGLGTVTCGVVGTEREPNDAPGTATRFAIGDPALGEVCPHDDNPLGDVDYWAFTAQAGTALDLDLSTAEFGVLSDPRLLLFASDGTTELAASPQGDDVHLRVSIASTGTYYAAVSSLTDPGGNPFRYRLQVQPIPPGPGDPVTLRAGGLGQPLGLAFGGTGDAFVGDVAGNRIVRITTSGDATTFATGIQAPTGLAFDAFGQLLVASGSGGVVFRVSPQGRVTPFITDAGFPFGIAVASDGRIWISDVSDRSLRRYSPTGRFETRFDLSAIGGSGPGPLAIGPSGEPYVSNGTEIWRLVGRVPQRVLTSRSIVWGFAFDVAGNIYAPSPLTGGIQLFDGTGRVVSDPFAVGAGSPYTVAFGRDQAGTTLARLFATDQRIGGLIEMNPAGVAHPGLPVGTPPPPFSLAAAAATLLGAGDLGAGDLQQLDALGNHNGRYDLGDFQAFLRSVGQLPGAEPSAVQYPHPQRRDR